MAINWRVAALSGRRLFLIRRAISIPRSHRLGNRVTAYACSNSTYPNSVVALRGLRANKNKDLNILWEFSGFPIRGELLHIATSPEESSRLRFRKYFGVVIYLLPINIAKSAS